MFKVVFSVDPDMPVQDGPRFYEVWLTLPDQRRVIGCAWRHMPHQWRVRFYGPDGKTVTVGARRLNTLRDLVKKKWKE